MEKTFFAFAQACDMGKNSQFINSVVKIIFNQYQNVVSQYALQHSRNQEINKAYSEYEEIIKAKLTELIGEKRTIVYMDFLSKNGDMPQLSKSDRLFIPIFFMVYKNVVVDLFKTNDEENTIMNSLNSATAYSWGFVKTLKQDFFTEISLLRERGEIEKVSLVNEAKILPDFVYEKMLENLKLDELLDKAERIDDGEYIDDKLGIITEWDSLLINDYKNMFEREKEKLEEINRPAKKAEMLRKKTLVISKNGIDPTDVELIEAYYNQLQQRYTILRIEYIYKKSFAGSITEKNITELLLMLKLVYNNHNQIKKIVGIFKSSFWKEHEFIAKATSDFVSFGAKSADIRDLLKSTDIYNAISSLSIKIRNKMFSNDDNDNGADVVYNAEEHLPVRNMAK